MGMPQSPGTVPGQSSMSVASPQPGVNKGLSQLGNLSAQPADRRQNTANLALPGI